MLSVKCFIGSVFKALKFASFSILKFALCNYKKIANNFLSGPISKDSIPNCITFSPCLDEIAQVRIKSFCLCFVLGQVVHAKCSCKTGQVGYCNHVLALMFKVCKFSVFDSKNTSDLCDGDDEQPDLAFTLQLQRWHKMGRGDKICKDMIAISYLASFAGTLCMNNLAQDKT